MGNGLLIRTAQIKTRQWSSFLLSFPSFSLHFPPSTACLPVCPACVTPSYTHTRTHGHAHFSLLSFNLKEEESVCMHKSLWGFPVLSSLSLLSISAPPASNFSADNASPNSMSQKHNILASSKAKNARNPITTVVSKGIELEPFNGSLCSNLTSIHMRFYISQSQGGLVLCHHN